MHYMNLSRHSHTRLPLPGTRRPDEIARCACPALSFLLRFGRLYFAAHLLEHRRSQHTSDSKQKDSYMKITRLFFAAFVAAFVLVCGSLIVAAQNAGPSSMKILRLSPALDQLIAPGVEPQVFSGGYVFTEGPMWRGGQLWFSDEEGDRVHAVTPDGHDTVVVDFKTGPYALPDGKKTGPNAMATSKDGSVVMCEQYGRAVVRLAGALGHVKPEPFFDNYQGKRLNSPNDLVFLPDGSFFFTDPPYGLRGHDHDPAKQLPFDGVFHYKDGKLTPIITDLTLPNGIALSPDNKTLYVNNSGPKMRVIAYPLHADGTVGPPA